MKKKLRHRIDKWQSLGSNPGSLAPESVRPNHNLCTFEWRRQYKENDQNDKQAKQKQEFTKPVRY
jgi:hypothetical protein